MTYACARFRTVLLASLIIMVQQATYGQCEPEFLRDGDSSSLCHIIDLTVVDDRRGQMTSTRSDIDSMTDRSQHLGQMITDRDKLNAAIKDCFDRAPLGGGSIEDNVRFRRGQQYCKSRASELFEEYIRKYPNVFKGIYISIQDYGECEVTDLNEDETPLAWAKFTLVPERQEKKRLDSQIRVMSRLKQPANAKGHLGLCVWNSPQGLAVVIQSTTLFNGAVAGEDATVTIVTDDEVQFEAAGRMSISRDYKSIVISGRDLVARLLNAIDEEYLITTRCGRKISSHTGTPPREEISVVDCVKDYYQIHEQR